MTTFVSLRVAVQPLRTVYSKLQYV